MKFISLVLGLFLITQDVCSQQYFNRLFEDFEFNPNPAQVLELEENNYLVSILSTVNGIRSSTFLLYNSDNEKIELIDLEGYSIELQSIIQNEEKDKLFFWGNENFSNKDSIILIRINKNFGFFDTISYYTNGIYRFATLTSYMDNNLYVGSVDDYMGGDHRETNIKKLDTLGNEIWSINFGSSKKFNASHQLLPSIDGNLFLSTGIVYYDKFGRYGQVIKIDTSGQILWTFEGEEAFDNGAIPTWLVELSDSTIVQYYEIFESQANEIVLQWLDKNGEPLFKRVYESPGTEEFHFRGLEVGLHGDYFFAYGNYRSFDTELMQSTTSALITKYDNNGDTIWTHRYRHPNYLDYLDFAGIRDIIELENGDIVAMGTVLRLGEASRVWLFKIDSEGCFNPNRCEEDILFTATNDIEISKDIKIYPNPTNQIIHIEIANKHIQGRLEIRNINGQLIMSKNVDFYQDMEVDISGLATGMYFISVTAEKGMHYIKKLLIDK